MKEVRIKKTNLQEIIAKNRTEHKDIFLEAQGKYREKAIAVLDEQLRRAREGAPFELANVVSLVEPQDHTKDYDRALQMLDLSVDETIVLSTADFANLVQDQWSWSRAWAMSNMNYSDNPKLRSLMND